MTRRNGFQLSPQKTGGSVLRPSILTLLACLAGGWTAMAQLTVKDGLVLWLAGEAGVTTNSTGKVVSWVDQSPSAVTAGKRAEGTDAELPTLVGNAVNGKPAVRFDGVENVLEIANNPNLQPQMGDWTVFFVAKRLNNSQGDFPEIIGSRPWVAGLDKGWAVSFDGGGLVGSHLADGSAGHDVPAVKGASALSKTAFQIWQVEENRAGGTTSFYMNYDLNAVRTSSMPAGAVDQAESIFIGREIGGANNRRANMDLAEVLVYNVVLGQAQRVAVFNYLNAKYNLGVAPNVPPVVSISSPANGVSAPIPAAVTLAAAASDTDGAVKRVDFLANNDLVATATAPPYSVPVQIKSPGSVVFTAIAVDDRGGMSTSAPVNIVITGTVAAPELSTEAKNGLALWLKADAGVTADGAGAVSSWADQSQHGNNATQDNAGAVPPANWQPVLVPNAVNGKPVIQFDGTQTFLQIANSPSLQPGAGDWTVIFVAERGASSLGDYPQVIGSRPWNAGLDKGWAVCLQNSSGRIGSHYADGVAGHDVVGSMAGQAWSASAFQVWQVEENRSQAVTHFYLQGRASQAVASAMPASVIDQANNVFIGCEVEGADSRRLNMKLAEILVYNTVLPASARENVTSYLLGKWAIQQISAADAPPAVSLTGLTNGTVLNAPAAVSLKATATDADGSIVRVEFFSGARSLGVATNSPYQVAATFTALGNQALTAVATDNLGVQTTSDPITIKVVAPNVQLIGKVDYSDTFTINNVRTDGLYNNNGNGAYGVEQSHGNAAAAWTPVSSFSFNTPGSSTDPAKLNAAQGNTGANSGLAQSGGGDFSLKYGLQSNYVVQVDAILPSDRLDISSLPAAGGGIFATHSLSVFLRRDTASQLPGIGLFNGAKETGVTNRSGALIRTGVADNHWHKFAVQFNQVEKLLRVHVDGVLIASVDLATFADGLYQDYANGAVGAGGSGGVFWMDNFQVGAARQLIATVDYQDTFTIKNARTDGLFNDNTQGAYEVEEVQGNPAAAWNPTSSFSFNTPGSATDPAKLTAATGNAGASTGFAQSGGGDFSMAYGLRSNYIIQLDAILPSDRLDITSLDAAGGGIFGGNKLSVFLRRDSVAGTPHGAFPDTGLPAIGLFNGAKETAVTDPSGNMVYLGVDDNNWHRYAIQFDQPKNGLTVYVDNKSLITLDLNAFAGGIYKNYSNGAVGAGGAGGVFWIDNFVAGVPEAAPVAPASLSIARQQNSVVISWTGGGTLEESASVAGGWTAVGGATSPHPVTPSAAQKFYRVSQ